MPVAGAMALRFSPDGRELTVVEEKGTLSFWDVATLEPTRRIRLELPGVSPAWAAKIAVLAVHPPVLAIADWSGSVSLWDAATGRFRAIDLASRTGTHWPDGARPMGWLGGGASVKIGPYRLGRGGDPEDDPSGRLSPPA